MLTRALWVPHDISLSLANAAVLAVATGHATDAARLFGAADRVCTITGFRFRHPEQDAYERAERATRSALEESAFAASWAEGQALSPEHATVEAAAFLSSLDVSTANRRSDGLSGDQLSPRELDVLRLLVAGQTDQQIADALFVSRRTVTTHVGNILAKLGVANRTEAVAHAVRHGLA